MCDLMTWCPHCGPRVEVDEDGCCDTCGADAVGHGADAALDALAGSEGRIARAEEERDESMKWRRIQSDNIREITIDLARERERREKAERALKSEHLARCAAEAERDEARAIAWRVEEAREVLSALRKLCQEVTGLEPVDQSPEPLDLVLWASVYITRIKAERDAALAKVAAFNLLPPCDDTEDGRCDLVRRYRDERDAARAEVERLRETVRAVVDACSILPVSAMRVMPLRLLQRLDELRVALAEHEEEVDRGTP